MKSRKSPRLKGRDYRRVGGYFVTMCTKDMVRYFGEVEERAMVLNEAGKICETYWWSIPEHFSHVSLDEFVIMPNHIHGIVFIDTYAIRREEALPRPDKEGRRSASSLHSRKSSLLKSGSLGSIIGSYKSICTKMINRLDEHLGFQRQSSYYDHIIRNEKDLNRIREYIRINPYKRENDEFYIR